ncbi:MAG: AAA family ATPase [Emticicia sp.]|uniref:AAA family ATPase n=1 Tax=Emticicia sp. TaxID=1930953 RepID=UPI003BA61D20
MKIRSLTLKNIGVFEDETISFPEKQDKDMAEIHILTGQNGTGKTTILQALAELTPDMLHLLDLSLFKIDKKIFRKFKYQNLSSYVQLIDSNNYEYNLNYQGSINGDFSEFSSPLDLLDSLHNAAFAYSGYRFIEHQENISIKEKENYNPLENALEFNKKNNANDYSLNEWLANKMAQRNSAFFDGNTEEVEKYSRGIETLKQIIEQIIEIPIDFKFKNEKLKVVAVKQGQELDFDLLPDGLRSIISWLGDLIMRMDALKWKDDLPIFEREFILFLDEIEVHLHPSWQRKILPVVQKLFKNAQIFITTHSPFIVNSVDGAYIYELKLDEDGHCKSEKPTISSTSMPIDEVLNEIYDIEPTQMYGQTVEHEIEDFQTELEKAYKKDKDFDKKELLSRARKLALKSPDLRNNVQFELRQLSKNLAEDFTI